MDSVDFNGIYITEKTLRIVYERCPNLQSLSLKGCGYLITDNVLQRLLKVRFCFDYELEIVSFNLCNII